MRHLNNVNYSLRPAQLREAESIYDAACSLVQHEFHGLPVKCAGTLGLSLAPS